MTQPRIAIATSDYHKAGQTFVNRHIEYMFGGNTCVYCQRFSGENPYDKAVFAAHGDHGPMDRLLRPVGAVGNRWRLGTSRATFGPSRRALARFLRAERVDLILAEFGTEAQAVHEVAAELALPCFSYFRGSDASHALGLHRRRRGYTRMMPHLTGIFTVSRFLLDNLAAHGFTHPNAHVIPSGVDVRRFTPGEKRPRTFLAVGRMVEKKAPLVTLAAFAAGTRGTDARLTFIGDGPLLAPTRRRAHELGVADRVTFAGSQPHETVRAELASTQTFLQHSLPGKGGNTEGLPTSIQEALSAGCLVISTRHAGIPEAVEDEVNGWLVPEHDEAAMADRIARSLTADTATMTHAARATALTRFDNADLLARTEDILRAAL